LVNNAGYALNGAFEDLAMEELKAQYETNLFGVTRLPLMRKQKSGIIVNISSGTVTMGGFPGGDANGIFLKVFRHGIIETVTTVFS
jgi:short-subunit dehydrogenase